MNWVEILQQFGLPTTTLFALGFWFYKKDNQHRKDFVAMIDKHDAATDKREDKYVKLSEDNHEVMTEVKVMLRTFIDITQKR